MHKQVQKKMTLFNKLPQYGKELLRSLDSTHELDRLQCNICSDYFNFENKKPVIVCKNKTCSDQHGVCQECFNDIKKFRMENHDQDELLCSFCKQVCFDQVQYDKSRFELIKKLSKVTETLAEISANAKLMTEKQTQKKLKQIVERAQKDIFKTSLESKRKGFLLNRLKKRINTAFQQNQKLLKNVEMRQIDLVNRQAQLKIVMEDIMKQRKDLQTENIKQKQLINELNTQNQILKKKLSEYVDISSLQKRKIKKHRQRNNSRQNVLYNADYYFNQFTFIPRRDQLFVENFNQNKITRVIQLKRQRQKYLQARGQKKILYHSQIFNYENEQQRLICFQLNSVNKNVTRYKFGLADQNYNQIKNASLYIHFQQIDEKQPLIITFYVNLIKMKLYATSNKIAPRSEDLPKKLNLKRFTVYLYFIDIKTQIIPQS